jgi:two-component system OmpR family response regulator
MESQPTQTILIVESDDGQRRELLHSFSRAGFAVSGAASWQEAVFRAEADRPDLAIVDAPEESFSGVCGQPALRGVPVVALSSEYCDRAIASEAGCSLCVEKPVDPGRLRLRVAEILAKRRSQFG